MDEVKKLELAIELAKLEALDRLRVVLERQEADSRNERRMPPMPELAQPGTGQLLSEALGRVEELLAVKKGPSAATIAASLRGGNKARRSD